MTRKALLFLWLVILADVAVNYASEALLRERRSSRRIRVVQVPVTVPVETPSAGVMSRPEAAAVPADPAQIDELVSAARLELARMDYGCCLWLCSQAFSADPWNDEVLEVYALAIDGWRRQVEERVNEIQRHVPRAFEEGDKVSMAGEAASLQDAVTKLANASGLVIEIDPALADRADLREPVSLVFPPILPTDALDLICNIYGVWWNVESVDLGVMSIRVHDRFYDVEAASIMELYDVNEPFKGVRDFPGVDVELGPYSGNAMDSRPYFESGSSSTAPSPDSTSSTR